MPQMGVSVAEGTVVAWRVEVGDRIEADETICEISTDKIDTEVPAPVDGRRGRDPRRRSTRRSTSGRCWRGSRPAAAAARRRPTAAAGPTRRPPPTPGGAADAPARAGVAARRTGAGAPPTGTAGATRRSSSGSPPSTASTSRRSPGTGRGGRVRKQDVLAFVESAPVEEPPLHIESPYRPEPVAPPRRRGRDGGAAVADAPADRRAHEALARDGGALHDVDRGRHEPGRGGPRARSA